MKDGTKCVWARQSGRIAFHLTTISPHFLLPWNNRETLVLIFTAAFSPLVWIE